MTTFNTGNPIGSTDARDRSDNSENLDLAVNSLSQTFVDRLGVTRDTLEGIYQKSAYYRAGNFEAGYTLTNNRQTLAYGNVEYSWSGAFPKIVSAASTPATSGGIGAGGWVDRSNVTLRGEIAGDAGAGLIGFSQDILYAPATVGHRLKNTRYITDAPYNADPTGAVDSTAAIQSAINDSFSLSGGRLFCPVGVYKLSYPLVIPFSAGWSLIGASKNGCVFKQYTNNTPILQFLTPLTHGFSISGIQFDYAVQQGPSNTMSNHLYFDAPTGLGSSGFFNFSVRDCSFANGFYPIASNNSANGVSVWGMWVSGCEFFGSNTGGAIRLVPSPACGQPNISIRDCYINCANHSLASLKIYYCDNLLCETVEFNSGWSYGASKVQIDFSTCSHVAMICCKSEQASIEYSGALWQFPNSNATILNCHHNGLTVGSGATSYRLLRAISGGQLSVKGFGVTVDSIATGGAVGLFDSSNLGSVEAIVMPVATGLYRQLPGDIGPKLDVDYMQPNKSTIRGDVSISLTIADTVVQYFNTALTNQRSITLPSTGVYAGLTFTIVRWALGAFILQVIDPLSGKSINLPASTKSSVTYRANSSGEWVPIQYSVFP